MVLVNALHGPMIVTDIKIAGQSVISQIRTAMLADGRLEDAEDDITLLPGERIELVDANTVMWTEE